MKAIFIGRFQQFHKGHLETIKWILKQYPEILIVIGSMQEFSTQQNPLTFNQRKQIIEKTLYTQKIKNFKIFGIPDFFNDILWAKKLLDIIKIQNSKAIIFTKNLWTKTCFEKINVKTISHPVFFNQLSASKIRKKIFYNQKWQNLVNKQTLKLLRDNQLIEHIKSSYVLPETKIINFIKNTTKQTKTNGMILGVSGGIDSAITALLAKKALNNKVFFINFSFTKTESFLQNIAILEKNLNINIKKIYLGDIYNTLLRIVPKGSKISIGNLKPRLRMTVLYYFANLYNLLVIGTSNKSELKIGYFTKFGD